MARITHIALRVADIEATSRFYETVFGFRHVNTVKRPGRRGDHISRHLTDGSIDLALLQYESDEADEADLSGPAPCIHHFGIEVEDLEAYAAALEKAGAKVVSVPGKLPIKFRAPGGPIAEIVPLGRYEEKTLADGTHGPVLK